MDLAASFSQAIRQNSDQTRVAVKRWCDDDLNGRVGLLDPLDDPGKVAIHVESQRQKIGQDYDAREAGFSEPARGGFERRLSEFEEGRHYLGVSAGARQIGSNRSHRLVGRFNAGSVGKDDDAGVHDPFEM